MKNTPFLYLTIIGASPAAQGKGPGSQLLNVIKDECDAQGLPLNLETETEQNVRFYEKHVGIGAKAWPMTEKIAAAKARAAMI